jgi:flagellar biosynthesis chaperone FliJ
MKRDPLAVLMRLRDAAVTEASRNLAAARARAMQEAQRLDEHRQDMQHEQSEADGEHVATFAAWLPRARLQRDRLQANLQIEESRVRHLQQVLVRRKTDAEAVVKAMQRQRAEADLIEARKEQGIMDEAAGRARQREAG